MTAKKESIFNPKASKVKAVPAKAPSKKKVTPTKKATKVTSAKQKTAVKKSPVKGKGTQAKSVTSVKSKQSASKTPQKKTSKTVTSKTKSVPKKAPVKKVSAKTKKANTISKVKEIVSKTIGKSQNDFNKTDSSSFTFEDAIGLLKSKNKSKPKKTTNKNGTVPNTSKVAKEKEKKLTKVKKLTTASIDDILGFGAPVVGVTRPVRDEAKVSKEWLPYYRALMASHRP